MQLSRVFIVTHFKTDTSEVPSDPSRDHLPGQRQVSTPAISAQTKLKGQKVQIKQGRICLGWKTRSDALRCSSLTVSQPLSFFITSSSLLSSLVLPLHPFFTFLLPNPLKSFLLSPPSCCFSISLLSSFSFIPLFSCKHVIPPALCG